MNRSVGPEAEVRIVPCDFGIESLESAEVLCASDPKAANSFASPDRVKSRPFDACRVEGGAVALTVPALGMVAGTFKLG